MNSDRFSAVWYCTPGVNAFSDRHSLIIGNVFTAYPRDGMCKLEWGTDPIDSSHGIPIWSMNHGDYRFMAHDLFTCSITDRMGPGATWSLWNAESVAYVYDFFEEVDTVVSLAIEAYFYAVTYTIRVRHMSVHTRTEEDAILIGLKINELLSV